MFDKKKDYGVELDSIRGATIELRKELAETNKTLGQIAEVLNGLLRITTVMNNNIFAHFFPKEMEKQTMNALKREEKQAREPEREKWQEEEDKFDNNISDEEEIARQQEEEIRRLKEEEKFQPQPRNAIQEQREEAEVYRGRGRPPKPR